MTCFTIALWAALAQDPFPVELAGECYAVKSTASKEEAEDLLGFMERVRGLYVRLFPLEKTVRGTLVLYRSQAEYLAAGGPRGAGAYYNGKELIGWCDPLLMRPLFAHEGVHQYLDGGPDLPMWFSEGVADCFGNLVCREGPIRICARAGPIAQMRLPFLHEAIRRGREIKLDTLFRLDRAAFMADANLHYAAAWSLCHYLLTGPAEEDRSATVPNGRYRTNLVAYFQELRKGRTHAEAWSTAFREISLDELQDNWKTYVATLDAGKDLGIVGEEFQRGEVAAIRIARVLKSGVAERAGLRKGDLLLSLEGKGFPRRHAWADFRERLQEIPYGSSVKIVLLRDEAEAEVTVSWPKR